jgi:hypothetical protein
MTSKPPATVRRYNVRTFQTGHNGGRFGEATPPYTDEECVSAVDYDALRAQLERARELLDICYDNLLSAGYKNDGPTLSGLTDFLKSLEDK